MTRLIVSIGDLTQTYDWPATISLAQVLSLAEQFRAKGYRAEVVQTPTERRREPRTT